MRKLDFISEPRLMFGHNQLAKDPRDGLTLFGPFDKGKRGSFIIGIIGTPTGIKRTKHWLEKVSKPIYNPTADIAKPFFPGFKAVFDIDFNTQTIPAIPIEESTIELLCRYSDSHVRVSELVDLYVNSLVDYSNENEVRPNLWIVSIPDIIYALGRPKSKVVGPNLLKVGFSNELDKLTEGLFETEETRRWRRAYKFDVHFHNQLKLKLLQHKILTQIIKESTIAYHEILTNENKIEARKSFDTAIAWNLATSIYYKIGGVPWKLGDIRKDICYIGLTFKKDDNQLDNRYACCAAQMFLDSGDGMVFRGRVGPYYNPQTNEYHLTEESAFELASSVLDSYQKVNKGVYPAKIYVHGKTYFNEHEWLGFRKAVEGKSELIGIRIRPEKVFKLYRAEKYPVLRGTLYAMNNTSAFLWTKGFIPRIQSILGLETPNPLSIQIIRGKANIHTVCKDIMSLTKLNYNSCIYGDGSPITLKFADTIGAILTSGPNENLQVLPFMYYI